MKLLDLTLATPAENLACDEALLDAAENGHAGEVLRFWESQDYFAVVGYANKTAIEVNVSACEAKGIPIHRRCSGGGTVLQGPGCLNYALVLKIADDGPFKTISSANKFIMERNRTAIDSVTRNQDSEVRIAVNGHTDLTLITHHSSSVTSRKFSGNSQRRRKHCLLFHGTFLLDFNLPLIGECLRMPSKEPGYREGRSHLDFVANLNLSASSIKQAMIEIWNANEGAAALPKEDISLLVTGKYARSEWNFKF